MSALVYDYPAIASAMKGELAPLKPRGASGCGNCLTVEDVCNAFRVSAEDAQAYCGCAGGGGGASSSLRTYDDEYVRRLKSRYDERGYTELQPVY